jgi:hypothetical protein
VKGKDTISTVINQANQSHDIDSLLVIHFHPEVQCSCCISVGNFARKALEKFYDKQYRDSVLIFRTYNIDEDTLTAEKYKIFWSALVFETFSGQKIKFKEIESVWEFCEDEEKYLTNFKKELDGYIVESKKTESVEEDIKEDVKQPFRKKGK